MKLLKAKLYSYEYTYPNIVFDRKFDLKFEDEIILKKKGFIYRELCSNIRLKISNEIENEWDNLNETIILVDDIRPCTIERDLTEYIDNFDINKFYEILKKDDYYKNRLCKEQLSIKKVMNKYREDLYTKKS